MTEQLSYEKRDPAGAGTGNIRKPPPSAAPGI
jgi:hypothetical protein